MLWPVGVRSQLKQKNIDNISKAEEQAARQNYEASLSDYRLWTIER